MKKLVQIALSITLTSQLMACGNITANTRTASLTKGQLSSSSASSDSPYDSIAANFNCPENPNINPKYDDPLVDEGRYKACRNRNGSYEYLFTSDAAMPVTLCAVPYALMNGIEKTYKASGGVIYAVCDRVYDNQVKLKLDGLAVPATGVMVVDQTDLDHLRSCIVNVGTTCPDFSKGNL